MATFPSTFFGLTIQPGKAYTTTFEEDTHLTMASLAAELPKQSGRTSVIITIEGATFTICSLTPSKTENQPLDFYVNESDEVTFSVVGPCPVDLTGNVVVMIPPGNDEFDDDEILSDEETGIETHSDDGSVSNDDLEEFTQEELDALEARLADSDDEAELTEREIAIIKSQLAIAGDDEELDSDEEDSEEEDDEATEMELDEALVAELKKRKAAPIPVNSKKAKITEMVEESSDEEAVEAAPKETKASKAQAKAEVKAEVKAKPEPKKKDESKIRKLPSGLVIEDVTIGNGPKAKSGKKVSVRYIGKLASNGKTFDSNTKGAPFTFKLGKGEVIKGWDVGVVGMNVGGTRKLTVPAPLAYGSRGAPPDIPKNATLSFEVKLLQTK